MEKRFVLALGLSFLVIFLYSSFLKKANPVVPQEVVANQSVSAVLPVSAMEGAKTPEASSQILNDYNTLETKDLYSISSNGLELKFSKSGGYLFEAYDKTNNMVLPFKNIGFVKEWSRCLFEPTAIDNGVSFEYRGVDGSVIKKTYQVTSSHALLLSIDFSNITNSATTSYSLLAGYFDPTAIKDASAQRYYEASVIAKEIVERKSGMGMKKPTEYSGMIGWAGLRDQFFCTVLVPQVAVNKAVINNIGKGVEAYLSIPQRVIVSSTIIEDQFQIYLGIQDEKALRKLAPGAEKIISYGTFDSISKGLMFLLRACHNVTRNWGVAIILTTMIIYIVLFPLSYKSMMSMKRMQTMQPHVEELRTKYKDNPQKLNTEIMELYKKEKINPLGGCLPMLLQIPVFFAFYQLMSRFIELRGAKFLWIQDLSAPDRLFIFKDSLPMVGNELNLLPLLMAVGMFFQQKMSSTSMPTSSSTADQQKIMGIVMPIMFGVLFYRMSSGLVLYWFVNNLLMLGFQWKISKIKH